MSIFEKASRQKIRFATDKGQLTTEDLWDLPLTSQTGKANLDDIAKGLFRTLKETAEVSFVTPVSTDENSLTKLKFDIVKHVIEQRILDRDAAAEREKNRQRKQLLQGIIAQKENDALLGSSLEDLKKMMDSL